MKAPLLPIAAAFILAAAAIVSRAMAFDTAQLGQGGSVMMGDIMSLVEQSPQLKREVTEAAEKINKQPDEILCGGKRFSGTWAHLGGYRVSPYVCAFGDDRFLEIRADVRITSRTGGVFEKITPDAIKNASRIRETRPTWKWLSEDPRLEDRK
jgi:hypothetical protein